LRILHPHPTRRSSGLFTDRGFNIVAIFDNDKAKVGQTIGKFTVEDTETMVERIKSLGVKIAMLSIPAAAAQAVAEQLVRAGVRAARKSTRLNSSHVKI